MVKLVAESHHTKCLSIKIIFNVAFSATDIADSMWNSVFGGQSQLKYTISPVAFTQEYSKYLDTKKDLCNVVGSSMNVYDILDIGKSEF